MKVVDSGIPNFFNNPFVMGLSGDAVSGKSSTIEAMIAKYVLKGWTTDENAKSGSIIIRVAAGKLFRKIADKAGIRVEELTKRARETIEEISSLPTADKNYFLMTFPKQMKESLDAVIDAYILNKVRKLREKLAGREAIIIADARIGGLLMRRSGEQVFNVRFSVQYEIAAERLIADAINRSNELTLSDNYEEMYEKAIRSVRKRDTDDRARFIWVYSKNIKSGRENGKVDVKNLRNYDLVINTSGSSIEETVRVLVDCIEQSRAGRKVHKNWRTTRYIYPVVIEEEARKSGTLKVFKVGQQYYVLSGNDMVGEANRLGGRKLFPVDILATDDQILFWGDIVTTAQELSEKTTQKVVEEFEAKYGFKYPVRGVKPLD